MADTGWLPCGTAENIDYDSKTAWANVDNITNGSSATMSTSTLPANDYSDYIRATNFGFTLPDNQMVTGIEVRIYKQGLPLANSTRDKSLLIWDGAQVIGDDKADTATDWPTFGADVTTGSTSDDWNAVMDSRMVNSADFGVQISAEDIGGFGGFDVNIGYIYIRLTYSTIPTEKYAIRTTTGWNSMTAPEQAVYDGTYTTISGFLAAKNTPLTDSKRYIAECFDDWPSGLAEFINRPSGYAADRIYHWIIGVADGNKHDGTLSQTSGFRLVHSSNGYTIGWFATDAPVEFEDMIIEGEKTYDGSYCVRSYSWTRISRCVILGNQGDGSVGIGLRGNGSYAENCLSAIVNPVQSEVTIAFKADDGTNTIKFYNCTAVADDSFVGATYDGGNNPNAAFINCVSSGSTGFGDYFFTSGTNHSNNASSDATAPGSNPITSITDAEFVDAASGDYHLDSGSQLVGAGLNLTGYFTDDIDGDVRPDAAFDMGADQYISPSETIEIDLSTVTSTVLDPNINAIENIPVTTAIVSANTNNLDINESEVEQIDTAVVTVTNLDSIVTEGVLIKIDLASVVTTNLNPNINASDTTQVDTASVTSITYDSDINESEVISVDVATVTSITSDPSIVFDEIIFIDTASVNLQRYPVTLLRTSPVVDTGWKFCQLGENIDRDGKNAWSNPNGIITDASSTKADVSIGTSTYSDWLRATNFSFAIDVNAKIQGIEAEFNRKGTSFSTSIRDNEIRLWDGSSIVGNNKSAGITWDSSFYVSDHFGSSLDMWGTSLTAAEVDSVDFGVQISPENTSGVISRTAYVDFVRMRVSYRVEISDEFIFASPTDQIASITYDPNINESFILDLLSASSITLDVDINESTIIQVDTAGVGVIVLDPKIDDLYIPSLLEINIVNLDPTIQEGSIIDLELMSVNVVGGIPTIDEVIPMDLIGVSTVLYGDIKLSETVNTDLLPIGVTPYDVKLNVNIDIDVQGVVSIAFQEIMVNESIRPSLLELSVNALETNITGADNVLIDTLELTISEEEHTANAIDNVIMDLINVISTTNDSQINESWIVNISPLSTTIVDDTIDHILNDAEDVLIEVMGLVVSEDEHLVNAELEIGIDTLTTNVLTEDPFIIFDEDIPVDTLVVNIGLPSHSVNEGGSIGIDLGSISVNPLDVNLEDVVTIETAEVDSNTLLVTLLFGDTVHVDQAQIDVVMYDITTQRVYDNFIVEIYSARFVEVENNILQFVTSLTDEAEVSLTENIIVID